MKWATKVACAALLAGALPAAAETMTSPLLYGSSSQAFAVCYVFNSGFPAIPITGFRLWSASIKKNYISKGDCPKSLPPFSTCQAIFPINSSGAYSCRVFLTGKANARASVEFRDVDTRVLNRADMR